MAGRLAEGIGRELANQLTVILGSLEMALDHVPSGDRAEDPLEQAKAAAARCGDLSRHLVSIAAERAPSRSKMDLATSILEARKLLEFIKPANIRMSAETEIGLFIAGNGNQIRQALLELGSNAFRAMSEGGTLDLRAYRDEHAIHVAVHDTGCGMTPSAQRRNFQSLYVSGLATVKHVMAAHDGNLGFESRVGEGTVFLMTFPAWEPEPDSTLLQ